MLMLLISVIIIPVWKDQIKKRNRISVHRFNSDWLLFVRLSYLEYVTKLKFTSLRANYWTYWKPLEVSKVYIYFFLKIEKSAPERFQSFRRGQTRSIFQSADKSGRAARIREPLPLFKSKTSLWVHYKQTLDATIFLITRNVLLRSQTIARCCLRVYRFTAPKRIM